jgi:two-component system sensor kinase FixL
MCRARLTTRLPRGEDSISAGAFRLSDAMLQALISDTVSLQAMVDGLIVIDTKGTITYVNPACQPVPPCAGDLIGRNVKMLMPPPFQDEHDSYLGRHREAGVRRIIGIGRELQGLKADGTIFPMYLSVGEAHAGDADIFVGIIYDLTEKKAAESSCTTRSSTP